MNVRRPALQRTHEHLVYQPNDWNLRRHIAQVSDIFLIHGSFDFPRHTTLRRVARITITEERLDSSGNFFFFRQYRLDPESCRQFHRVQAREIQRIGRGHHQLPAFNFERHYTSQFEKIRDAREEFNGKRGCRKVFERDEWNVEMIPQHRQEIVFREKPQLDEQPSKGSLLFLLQLHDPLHLLR